VIVSALVGASEGSLVIATPSVCLCRRSGLGGLGNLHDLVGDPQQFLVLLVFFLDRLPLVVGQDLGR
jgi:hypothetical protein